MSTAIVHDKFHHDSRITRLNFLLNLNLNKFGKLKKVTWWNTSRVHLMTTVVVLSSIIGNKYNINSYLFLITIRI